MTTIATIAANSVLTSTKVNEIIGGINGFGGLQATKSTDESVISNTTLQDDDELLVALAASSVYDFDLDIYYNSPVAAKIKFGFTYPAGTVMRMSFQGYAIGAMQSFYLDQTGVNVVDGNASSLAAVYRGRIITSSTAGNVRLQFAQSVSTATNTTVLAGSAWTLIKVG